MKVSPRLIVFDVGHGCCLLLQDGKATTVIDCKESTLLIEYLISQKIRSISQVIISHADADHIDGVLALVQSDYIKIGTVFVNPDAKKDTETWTNLRIALQDASARGKLKVRTEIGDGMPDQLRQEDVRIEAVAPGIASRLSGPGGRTGQKARATSNTMSVVLRLHHKGHPLVLIPGDLDNPGLEDLIARRKSLKSKILIFPHHGGHIGHGGTSAARKKKNALFAQAILNQVSPELILFSIGRGKFDTPRPEIVQEIATHDSNCYIRCTQLSEHCERNISKEHVSDLSDLPAFGRSGNGCCGGSFEITFSGKNTVKNLDHTQHARFIDSRVTSPLCRKK